MKTIIAFVVFGCCVLVQSAYCQDKALSSYSNIKYRTIRDSLDMNNRQYVYVPHEESFETDYVIVVDDNGLLRRIKDAKVITKYDKIYYGLGREYVDTITPIKNRIYIINDKKVEILMIKYKSGKAEYIQ